MSTPLVLAFSFGALCMGLVWAVMVVLNLWIWQKSKATGNLLMLIGAAMLSLPAILGSVGAGFNGIEWMAFIGSVLIVAGFYMSVKPMVEAQIAALQAKMKHAAQSVGHKDAGSSGGTPPAAPPPASN